MGENGKQTSLDVVLERIGNLKSELGKVDDCINDLYNKFNNLNTEVARLKDFKDNTKDSLETLAKQIDSDYKLLLKILVSGLIINGVLALISIVWKVL